MLALSCSLYVCKHSPVFLPAPIILHPSFPSPLPLLLLSASISHVLLCSLHSLLPTADLQRATPYTCGACCCGDLDRQGSHPHKCEAAGTAARFLQVPAAKHQAPCRFCAATLVSSPFGGWTDRLGWSLLFWFCSDGSTLCLPACN